MSMPRGLQKPHHFAELIFPLLAFAIVAWSAVGFWAYIGQTNGP